MQRNYFTDKEMEELSQCEYVKKITKANICFTTIFKQKYYSLLLDGVGPTLIFIQSGMNPKILGQNRIKSFTRRIRKQAKREEGFNRKKGFHAGRPKKITFNSPEEEIKYLKGQLEYVKQENDFLKKLDALDKKYQ